VVWGFVTFPILQHCTVVDINAPSVSSLVLDHFTAPYYVVHKIISVVLRGCDQLDYQLSCRLRPYLAHFD
jgi:hypothetical protein